MKYPNKRYNTNVYRLAVYSLPHPAMSAVARYSNENFTGLRFYGPNPKTEGTPIFRRFRKELTEVMRAHNTPEEKIDEFFAKMARKQLTVPTVKVQ